MKYNINQSKKPLIAIIGIGCRFPGNASNAYAFWELLKTGVDAIIDVPQDRWDLRRFYDPQTEKPGKMHTRQAGFLKENIYEFDPFFFGISPREAENLDPQQRLLLEVTYEAIEDAGLPLKSLQGSDTGVFIGGFTFDQAMLLLSKENREMIHSMTAVNVMMTMLSNRISYTFDLRGPSVSMDTACSSSLVATHYACQSIWNGECSMAIVGGVNIMLKPEFPILLSKGQFTSKHGRCKTFDREASGYARGEGAGVILLKSYPQALKDKDFVYALIRATGVNQDGRTNGITVPNPEAQKALIKKVYQQANLDVNNIHYVEAHGTGTSVGDRVELQSLNAVLSEGREPNNKCLVGSVKTNIGHLEAGAGIASVIKTALCLENNQVPPNLHFNTPSPGIDFDRLCLKIPTQVENLPGNESSFASVNAFGYGGTNAHAVLQQVPQVTVSREKVKEEVPAKKLFIIPITARDDGALKELAKRYYEFLNTNTIKLRDFIYSTTQRRSHHKNRLALVAETKEELIGKLKSYSNGMLLKGMAANLADIDKKPKLVFVYTGMGPQWWRMGRELMEAEPVFRQMLEECDELFQRHSGWSILKELLADEAHSKMAETRVAQPANFLIQAALSKLLKTYGIVPDAVVGHSVGEIPAAYISGALSLKDALLVTYHRSRLQQTTAGSGTMLAIGIPENKARELIKSYEHISISAVNSPHSVTLSGKEEILKQISKELDAKEIFNRILQVEIPYHSYLMDPIEKELLNCLQDIEARENQIPIYSTVTGGLLHGTEFDADYWWSNVRQPVKFANAIESIIRDGYTIFLEVGPHPVLKNSIKECLDHAGQEGYPVQTLNRKEPETLHFFEGLATLFTLGIEPDWQQIPPGGNYIKLPSYPWQKQRFWRELSESRQDRFGLPSKVFFNTRVQTPEPTWEVELNEFFFPFINDHIVQHTVVLPGATYAAAGLELSQKDPGQDSAVTIEDIEFHQILPIDNSRVQVLHLTVDPGTNKYSVYSRFKEEEAGWRLHATGRILPEPIDNNPGIINLHEIKKRCATRITAGELYKKLASVKLEYGPYFRTITEAWKGDGDTNEMLAKIVGHESLAIEPDKFLIHPTILDGSFQAMVVFDDNNKELVPVSIGRLTCFHSPGIECWCYIKIKQITDHSITGDITLCDEMGTAAVEIENLLCREIVRRGGEEKEQDKMIEWFYDFQWQESEGISLSPPAKMARWLVFTNENEYSRELSSRMALSKVDWIKVTPGNQYKKIAPTHYQIRSHSPDDMQHLLLDTTEQQFSEILYLWAMAIERADAEICAPDTVDQCMPLIYLTQALAKGKANEEIRITIVTQDAQIVTPGDKGEAGLSAAPLWGLGHLIGNEYPNFTSKIIDMEKRENWQSRPLTEQVQHLANEILSGNTDEDVALRGNKRWVKRLEKASWLNQIDNREHKMISTETPVELTCSSPGEVENLYFREFEQQKPGKDEITIKVHAVVINDKSLLKVLGKNSPDVIEGTYFKGDFPMEVSGVVTSVGERVTGYNVGDELVAVCPSGNFKSFVTLKPGIILPKPDRVFHEEAVIMAPYLTALYSLKIAARLQKGEKLLIHNAASTEGLAAIQYARWKGAEIYATADTPGKQKYLNAIDIEHVMDSRTLKYTKTIKEITHGYGVDVVINTLTGESLYQNLSLLAPHGRLIQIGNNDIDRSTYLPMGLFNRDITFAMIDIHYLILERSRLIKELLPGLSRGFAQGYFYPLPIEVFPVEDAVKAFKRLAEDALVGAVVLDFHKRNVPVNIETGDVIKTGATYLITGGTGGLGLEIAKWLAGKGASHIVLISRSGAKAPGAQQAIAQMERQGTQVYAAAADITAEEQVKQLIHHMKENMPPLAGIFHCAAVLDDGFLKDMDNHRFTKVMLPKVAGVLHLHKYTRDFPLDFFISFSSISSIIGNPGQGNYVAANAFLDVFSHYRRALGLPATTINLGALKEVGMVTRSENTERILEGTGVKGMTTQDVLRALELVIEKNPVQIGIYDIDWQKWADAYPRSRSSSRFQTLIKNITPDNKINEKQSFIRQLLDLDKTRRLQILENFVLDELSRVLKLDPGKIDINRGLNSLGIDSIMVAELVRALNTNFGLDISPVLFLSGPNVRQVAALIEGKISSIKN
jgi:acyl transferase domain-containing protein/NADPH:quinone reductase-like Zn-dependent oxidoreductase/acyl carrier protein